MSADYAFKFVRVTISGTCFGGAEEWSTGFQLGSPSTDMVGAQAPGAQSIATAWQTFFTSPTSHISGNYLTTQVKCALIERDGKTNLDEIDYYTYPVPLNGGGGGAAMPAQITLAATLTSDNQRGLAAKGRMYLPGINGALDLATGKIAGPTPNNIATNLKTFLDAVNTGVGVSGRVVLASKGRKTTNLGTDGQPIYIGGKTAWVTGCRVGDVYDTQRRRRNGFNETYLSRVLAA